MRKRQGAWQNIIWREWRNCEDEDYAKHLFSLIGDEPVGWGVPISLTFLGALCGAMSGLLIGLITVNVTAWTDLEKWEPQWSGLWAFIWIGAAFGWFVTLVTWFFSAAARRLTWRKWVGKLAPDLPSTDLHATNLDSELYAFFYVIWGGAFLVGALAFGFGLRFVLRGLLDLQWSFMLGDLWGGASGTLLGAVLGLPFGLGMQQADDPDEEVLLFAFGALVGLTVSIVLGVGLAFVCGLGVGFGVVVGLFGIASQPAVMRLNCFIGGPFIGTLLGLAAWLSSGRKGLGLWLLFFFLGIELIFGFLFWLRLLLKDSTSDTHKYRSYWFRWRDRPSKYRSYWFRWRDRPSPFAVEMAIQQACAERHAVQDIWIRPLRRLETSKNQENYDVSLISHSNWEERFIARQTLAALGGKVIPSLCTVMENYDSPLRPTAVWLLKHIPKDILLQFKSQAPRLLCPHCLTRCRPYVECLSWRRFFTYYRCRACNQYRDLLQVQMVAVLDEGMVESRDQQNDILRVNWLRRRSLFDFDWIEIVQATDEDVERFAVQVGNDTDVFRRPRYKKMRCVIVPGCDLSENTMRILKRLFGRMELAYPVATTKKEPFKSFQGNAKGGVTTPIEIPERKTISMHSSMHKADEKKSTTHETAARAVSGVQAGGAKTDRESSPYSASRPSWYFSPVEAPDRKQVVDTTEGCETAQTENIVESTTSLTLAPDPVAAEFRENQTKLSIIETQLVKHELELATLQAELRGFEVKYLRIVGKYYAELDDTKAQIAEALARMHPEDDTAQDHATQARAYARESAEASGTADVSEQPVIFKPSAHLKKLFREIAKRLHPDLGVDEEDRDRRNQFMARINDAYRNEDEARLQHILHEWEDTLDTLGEVGAEAELERIMRKIAQVTERLRVIEHEITQLRVSDLYRLKIETEEAQADGRDLLSEMADRVKALIIEARSQLRQVLEGGA